MLWPSLLVTGELFLFHQLFRVSAASWTQCFIMLPHRKCASFLSPCSRGADRSQSRVHDGDLPLGCSESLPSLERGNAKRTDGSHD